MQAFYGIPELKEHYLGRIKMHQDLDHITQGVTWESNGKIRGCAIGCSFEKYDHNAFVHQWNGPKWLAILEDRIFENLPKERALEWPYDFCEAINVGADLEKIKIPFLILICESVLEYVQGDNVKKQRESIEAVIVELKRDILDFGKLIKIRRNTAYAASSAAAAVYASTSYAVYASTSYAVSASVSYAVYAASYAAEAAASASSAASASYTAAEAASSAASASAEAAASASAEAAASASYAVYARHKKFEYFADKLLQLMRECKGSF